MLAGEVERALALDRASERAHLALELELVEHQARSAHCVREHRAAVNHIELLDRDRVGIEGDGWGRPVDLAAAVEPDRDIAALDADVGGADFAANERVERELKPELAGLECARVARAGDLDLLQHQCRGRQQADVDRPGDPHIEAGHPARVRFEISAVVSPVDKKRPDQRCHQRQDDRNRQSQQRRLHAVSKPDFRSPSHPKLRAGALEKPSDPDEHDSCHRTSAGKLRSLRQPGCPGGGIARDDDGFLSPRPRPGVRIVSGRL